MTITLRDLLAAAFVESQLKTSIHSRTAVEKAYELADLIYDDVAEVRREKPKDSKCDDGDCVSANGCGSGFRPRKQTQATNSGRKNTNRTRKGNP